MQAVQSASAWNTVPATARYIDRSGMRVPYDYNVVWTSSDSEMRLLGWCESYEHAATKARIFAHETVKHYNSARGWGADVDTKREPHAARFIEAIAPVNVENIEALTVENKPLLRIEVERPAVLGRLWNTPRKSIGTVIVYAIMHVDDFRIKPFLEKAVPAKPVVPAPTQPAAAEAPAAAESS
jgi:hypothetical protein